MKKTTKNSEDIVNGYVIAITPKDYKEQCNTADKEECAVYKDGNKKNVHLVSTDTRYYVCKKAKILQVFLTRKDARNEKDDTRCEAIWAVRYDSKTGKIVEWVKRNP